MGKWTKRNRDWKKRVKVKDPKAVRRGTNAKAKGGGYERSVCKRLSQWVSKLAREDVFWRSAMSGGRARVHFGKREANMRAQCGDVTAIHQLGNLLTRVFVIECKHLKDLEFQRLPFGRKGMVGSMWGETLQDAKDFRRLPMMVALQNRQTDVVVLSQRGYDLLSACGKLPINATFPRLDMVVCFLRDVLTLDYDIFHRNNYDRFMGRVRIRPA